MALKVEKAGASADSATSWVREMAGKFSSATMVKYQEPLAPKTTFRVGGAAEVFVMPGSESDLSLIVRTCHERNTPWFVLGRGSNLLVKDGGVKGVVVSLQVPWFSQITVKNDRLICGAGARLRDVAMEARRQGWTGMEFFEGIPGSVGGALHMNAGAMGASTFDVVEKLRYLDREGTVHECAGNEAGAEYRRCTILSNSIALQTVFLGKPENPEVIKERMSVFNRKRWDSQPAAPSAGCIFKNPPEGSAGKLVDECGLKGLRVGDAMVSFEHGNFIVNEGEATAKQVLELIDLVKAKVSAAKGVNLKTEVEIVGEDE